MLRGRIGTIHSWVLDKNEDSVVENGKCPLKKLPRVVFVKFLDAEGKELPWRLPGLSENGLYPIVPKKRTWYLDKTKKYPQLKISRQQLPLAPAYAITSHASQGQTLEDGAIVDLRIGKGTSPISSYVALTRVKNRNKLLIYRPFERELFTQGEAEGPALLMKKLRGDDIDWQAIVAKHMPQAMCVGCGIVQFKKQFPPHQWSKPRGGGFGKYCKECVELKKAEGTPWECTKCKLWLTAECFRPGQLTHNSTNTRVCKNCIERRTCRVCNVWLEEHEFTAREWISAQHGPSLARKSITDGKCKDCKRNGLLKCSGPCGDRRDRTHFSAFLETTCTD